MDIGRLIISKIIFAYAISASKQSVNAFIAKYNVGN